MVQTFLAAILAPSPADLRSLWGATEYQKNPQVWKYEKKYEKNYKIAHSGLGPKNTEKIQKNYENGHFLTVFVIFWYFFCTFWAQPSMGDFVNFSDFFRISGLEGFLYSVPPQKNLNGRTNPLEKPVLQSSSKTQTCWKTPVCLGAPNNKNSGNLSIF